MYDVKCLVEFRWARQP